MTYNRNLYNSALYNAGRSEAGAAIKSLISAHTGPHIKAVVGVSGGVTFISDFNIVEGSISKPPTSFRFPDLSAIVTAIRIGTADLGASIHGFAYKDLLAKIFPVETIPDLVAYIKALASSDIQASILGMLAEANLGATLFVAIHNLSARIFSFDAPTLSARITPHLPANLGARIWSPLDLLATINYPYYSELPASISGHLAANLIGKVFPVSRIPNLRAYVNASQSSVKDLIAYLKCNASSSGDLGASVAGAHGDFDLTAILTPSGAYQNLIGYLTRATAASANLQATLGLSIGNSTDLAASISFYGAKNISASISALPLGAKDRFLPAIIQSLNIVDLSSTITGTTNRANLAASVTSFPYFHDLSAFLRAAETYITSLFTVSTLASADLRASIGVPSCAGGTGILNIAALLTAKNKGDLHGTISAYQLANLGAQVNTTTGLYYFDTVNISYTPQKIRIVYPYLVSDTINIVYAPFRGQNLNASIIGDLPSVNLAATLRVVRVLPRVMPVTSKILSADLRSGEAQNIQEIRLQLEGTFFDFIYINGTNQAFIRDYTQKWKLNIRSFKAIAANLFGDFAAARICRLGDLSSFDTIDAAVRACIDAVLGLSSQTDLGASITVRGGFAGLSATLGTINIFTDIPASVGRVFPSDLLASVASQGDYGALGGIISGVSSTSSNLTASIDPYAVSDIGADITGI